MKKTSEPIVFFGSGPVAADSLRLLAQDFPVEAVVTKPRAAHHKGSVPVIETAEELSLPIFTVINKAGLDELVADKPFKSRLGILIDFGIIVSRKVIDYFPLGILNSHFSVLPEWRGADPITFAILSGQEETGISLMLLVEAMDEGPLLAQAKVPISQTATTPELTKDLVGKSYNLLQEVVPKYLGGVLMPYPQPDNKKEPTYSRKLTKEDGVIDWNKPARQIEREIRAFIEWPKSLTTIGSKDLIITKSRVIDADGPAGKIQVQDNKLVIFAGERALLIEKIKPEGKNEMSGEAFIAGYKHLLS